MIIGARIKELRLKAGIKVTALAKQVEITREYLTNVESGKYTPSFETLSRICAALGVTLAEFFAEEAPDMPPEVSRLLAEVKDLSPAQVQKLTEFIQMMKGE